MRRRWNEKNIRADARRDAEVDKNLCEHRTIKYLGRPPPPPIDVADNPMDSAAVEAIRRAPLIDEHREKEWQLAQEYARHTSRATLLGVFLAALVAEAESFVGLWRDWGYPARQALLYGLICSGAITLLTARVAQRTPDAHVPTKRERVERVIWLAAYVGSVLSVAFARLGAVEESDGTNHLAITGLHILAAAIAPWLQEACLRKWPMANELAVAMRTTRHERRAVRREVEHGHTHRESRFREIEEWKAEALLIQAIYTAEYERARAEIARSRTENPSITTTNTSLDLVRRKS